MASVLVSNRKATHNYSILNTLEAGIALFGSEVKSIRLGQASLAGSYVSIRQGQAYLKNAYIGRYSKGSGPENYDENRERSLLLHKNEILKLARKLDEKGTTLVPLEIYSSKKLLKLKIGLALGKKQFDKRESIKLKESKRNIQRAVKQKVRQG